MIDEDVAN